MAVLSQRTGENVIKTLQGFKDFIMRGNVIDLSVGIVIGAAFTALVTAFTKAFVEPLIRVFGGGGELSGTFKINEVVFDFASFLNALITFVITAAVVYFLIVTPMNRLAERRRRGMEPEPKAPSEEVILLQQIRDALLAAGPAPRQRVGGATSDLPEALVAARPEPAKSAPTVRNTPQPRKSQGRSGGSGGSGRR
jgi:large conductance mechanosensitive channel